MDELVLVGCQITMTLFFIQSAHLSQTPPPPLKNGAAILLYRFSRRRGSNIKVMRETESMRWIDSLHLQSESDTDNGFWLQNISCLVLDFP